MFHESHIDEYDFTWTYHPDYASATLSTDQGNTEFISDLNGEPYQYFCLPRVIRGYSPFGELLDEDNSLSGNYNSYFRFNGKELDPETGNYYYGARYYDPKVSVWLSVDQRAHWYPDTSPYAYVLNNPVNLIDPTGMSAEDPGSGIGGFFKKLVNWLKGDEWYAPSESAEEIMEDGQWNLEQVEVSAPKPEKKQNYGEPQFENNNEQGIKWPDAHRKGDPQEMFPMTGPGKALGGIAEKIAQGLGILKKWISWGVEHEIPHVNSEQKMPLERIYDTTKMKSFKWYIDENDLISRRVDPDSLKAIVRDEDGNIVYEGLIAK